MNKNRFRIIFNVARGMMMVVAEFVKSHMSGAESTNHSQTEIPLTKVQNDISVTLRPLAFSMMLALGTAVMIIPNPANINSAHAEARAATNVPGNQRATVLSAPNGVEVVNIQTPSAAGVSRNVYEILNVPTQGMIFNNSRTNVQTELGGWIQGNPWLATGSARIILNEINSSNPSYLNGYMEVAGSRAELIIANPNGISCNGCGFINASRGVLTTGTPILSGGDLTGYRVTGGTVNIWGKGLDASRTNYTDIIARAVEVNAGIWANNLSITTGANEVNAANSRATAIAASSPAPASGLALDVAALGGMYAGKITLIGTEAGLGVRNAGVMNAATGNLILTADGQLQNTGNMIGNGDVAIATSATISNNGTLYAQGNTSLSTQADITNSGLIAAQGNTTLTANGANSHISNTSNAVLAAGLKADGTLTTSGNLNISATQSVTALGQNLSAGDQTLTAKQLDISGSNTFANNLTLVATLGDIQAQNATISANQALTASTTQTLTTDGATVAANQLNLVAHDLSNIGGTLIQTGAGDTRIHLAGDLNNDQGRIATNSNNLTLAAQTLTNTGGSIEHAGSGTLAMTATTLNGAAGQIISNGALDLTAITATLDNGSTIAKRINVDTATLSNRSGEIIQTGSDVTSIHASISLDNTDGIVAGNGTTTLTVGDLINQGGTIQAAGTSNLTVNATGTINNTSLNSVVGNINAGGTAIITADSINNTQGQIAAGDTLNISTTSNSVGLQNTQGLIASNQALILNTASLDNSSGTIASVHDGVTITANLGSINNSAGQISAAKALTTSSFGFNNTAGTVSANSAVINSQLQTLDNTSGNIITQTDLDLQTGALTNDNGLIQSGANLVVNTHNQTLTNINSGTSKGILALGSSTFITGDLNNQTGYIGTQGAITANSANIYNNSGSITGGANLALNGSSVSNQSGRVEALGNLDINSGSNVDNRSGLLRSGQTLTLTTASLDNRNTQGLDQGNEGASVSINADQVDNTSGAMRADNALAITGSSVLNNSQGNLSSAGSLDIADRLADTTNVANNVSTKTLAITNTGGTIIAGSGIAGTGLNIDSRSLTGDGKVLSQGDLTTKLTTDYTHSGEWQADGNASLTTTGSITNQAKLLAGGNLDITAANINNQASGEVAGANLNMAVTNTLTNRGLLDGSNTFINTTTLNNIGTGRIYGDHVAIAATTLNNLDETVNNNGTAVTTAAVIAARDRLDIGAANITNREHALLFSAGDMAIGGALDANHQATVATGQPQAAVLNNNSATIEALGNLALNVSTINNTNEHFTTTSGIVSESTTPARSTDVRGLQLTSGSPAPAPGNTRQYQLSYFSTDGAYLFGDIYNYDQVSFYTPGFVHIVLNPGVPDAAYTDPLTGSKRDFVTFMQYNTGTIVTETSVATTDPGQILAGGSMQINATDVLNSDSKIIAGGALNGNIANLNNQETLGTRSSWSTSQSAFFRSRESCYCSRYFPYLGDTAPVIETINLGTATYLGNASFTGTNTQVAALNTGSVSQTATGAGNANVAVVTTPNQGGNTQLAPVITNTQTGAGTIVRTVTPNTSLPNNSLYHTNPNPTGSYYVETDPRFANYRNWLSSDYMLKALSYDPAMVTKRLGDGFYEQRLIREQISELTGKRFLAGYSSDEAEYQALMTNGITFAQTYQLIPGVALTEAQIAQLTSDIVWLVEKTITLADGTTVQALVPQVYVKLQEGDIDGAGSLLAGDSINLKLSGDLTNSGSIAGRTVVSITADNINNLQGRISGNNTQLNARNDINNLGGSIQGGDSLILSAGHDINIASTTQSNRMQYDVTNGKLTHVDVSRTNIDRVAGLYVTNPNGVLIASSDNNINLQGAVISNAGENGVTVLDAGHDLNLSTITVTQNNSYVRDSRNYSKNNATQEIGTVIQTQGDIILNAGNNLTARAANVSSEQGQLTANAGNDVSIEAGLATSHSESASYSKKKGTFSSKTKTTRDTYDSTDVVSSTFSADEININAGNDLTVKGSNVVGTNDVNLNAGNNVTLDTAQATHDETHYSKTKKSGFSSSGSSVGYGTSKLTTTNDTQTVTNVGSTVGSVEGDVNINAGKAYTQTGSDVLTPKGDINITAQSVDINAATDTYANQQTMKYKQSGITIGVSNPVISAAQTANQMSQAASQTSDGRMQALAAGTTALAVNNAYNAVQAGQGGNAADQAGGISLSISIGTSKASSSSSQTVNTAKGSTLNAGGDINITASGAGQDSDINVIGSQIKAAHNVTLNAQDEINLAAAQNTSQLQSKNKSSSASIGVSVSLGANAGVGITAGISSGKGKANGNGTTWTETQIQGGNQQGDQVTLSSGTDTNIKGAQVSGNQVIANVGTTGDGDLNIQSLQDTDQYKAKQSSNGISVTVPVTGTGYGGSFSSSKSNTKSNYQSVNEQSGIYAGDGGFQVNVNGNTDLKGAVIASTDKAIHDNANSLTTQTLTTSNIENSAAYDAKGYSVAAGVGFNKQPDGTGLKNTPTASAGSSHLSDDSNSVTVSGISGGAVNITDSTTQQTKTGKDTITTVATLNRDVQTQITTGKDAQGNATTTVAAVDSKGNNLNGTLTPIFDKEQVQRELNAQIQITQAFSQVAPKAVGDYAASQISTYEKAQSAKETAERALNDPNSSESTKAHAENILNQANAILNDPEQIANYDNWKEGGAARVALHAIVGGLTGNLEGAIGAGTSAITIPMIGDELAKLDIPVTLKQALVEATAIAIGGAVGGTAGAGAAFSEAANNYLTHTQLDKVKSCLNGSTCSSKEEKERAVAEAERISKVLDDNMDSVCTKDPMSDACRTAVKAAIEYVAMRDAWQYMNSDVSRSASNTFDYLYNSNGAEPRFVKYLNTIDKRADFFQASDNYEQNIGIGAQWFGGANQVSRAPLTGLGAGEHGSSVTFWFGSLLPGDQYAWRDAAGNALITGGFDNFKDLYNGNVSNATQWDINQLKNEQSLLQPIHEQYLGNAGAFVGFGQQVTDINNKYFGVSSWLGGLVGTNATQGQSGGINILDYKSRVQYGCQLLGYTAIQGCKP